MNIQNKFGLNFKVLKKFTNNFWEFETNVKGSLVNA